MKHYHSIKNRTTHPSVNSYENYGGVGIKLCKEWLSDPMLFVEYMRDSYKEGLTIDRIDNNKGYEPGNVRWATPKEQALNKKTTILVEWQNEKMAISTFIRRFTKLSVSQGTLLYKKGWTLEQLQNHTPRKNGTGI